MRAAGVRASGDELDEHDLQALWERAEGPYASLGAPATVVPIAERLVAERPDRPSPRPPRRGAASSPSTSPPERERRATHPARRRARPKK